MAAHRRDGRVPRSLLGVALLVGLAVVYAWFALGVRAGHGLSGDEPHYLAITQSLWLYHTFDQHRVLYHHDFYAYYPRLMSSHALHRGGHLYPLHYLGLPLALLPGFALAGATGALATTALLAALLGWRTWHIAARVAGPLPAALATGVLALSAPFVLNAGAIYPDLLSGLLVVLAYEAADAPRLTVRRALALGLVLGAMPWLHVKLLVVVGAYLIWAAHTLQRGRRALPAPSAAAPAALHAGNRDHAPLSVSTTALASGVALGLPVASLAGLGLFNLAVYGSPSLTAQFALRGQALLTGNPLGGIVGQLFAQGQGALGTAPFVLLAIPGAVALWRRDRASALKIGLVTLPFWLVTLTYRDWWGGDCPPLRYLTPLLPLWGVGIAALLAGLRTAAARLAVGLLALATLALTGFIPAAPRLGWPLPDGRGALLAALDDRVRLPLTPWLPRFTPTLSGPGHWHNVALIPLWATALLALWSGLAYWERRAYRR